MENRAPDDPLLHHIGLLELQLAEAKAYIKELRAEVAPYRTGSHVFSEHEELWNLRITECNRRIDQLRSEGRQESVRMERTEWETRIKSAFLRFRLQLSPWLYERIDKNDFEHVRVMLDNLEAKALGKPEPAAPPARTAPRLVPDSDGGDRRPRKPWRS